MGFTRRPWRAEGISSHWSMFASVSELRGVVLSVITLQITGEQEDFDKTYNYIRSLGISFEEVKL